MSDPEVWLRGPVPGYDPMVLPVVHSLLQVREDLARLEAMAQLRARRANFAGLRSLMRVRATTNGKTQSFRAQLAVQDGRRMELIAYTPVGTTALTLKARRGIEAAEGHLKANRT